MRIQDRLNKLKNKRGFTLVELMIVVAIIGVLAALAIYGVRKYLTNAKTAEARMAVGRIAKDGSSAFERETMAAGAMPLGSSAGIGRTLCPAAGNTVPSAIAKVKAQKYQSSLSEWSDGAGWTCLRFSMTDPQYFMYDYNVSGTLTAAGGQFTAVAQGDLDGDGTPSTFSLMGTLTTDGQELVVLMEPAIQESSVDE